MPLSITNTCFEIHNLRGEKNEQKEQHEFKSICCTGTY
jgi:hypothetical protein